MNEPVLVFTDNFQVGWAKMIVELSRNRWELFNAIVQMDANCAMNTEHHELLNEFADIHRLINPKQVAHTIFPYHFYREGISRDELYRRYWRFFDYTRGCEHSGWGTYFERMIRYKGNKGQPFDQLGAIIDNLNNRARTNGHCNVMIIPYSSDQNRTMGQPCLNYVSVQVENNSCGRKIINLLAVYRNHDFRERAYGNYLGLLKLLEYIATETGSLKGYLTCVSSHAFLNGNNKSELLKIAKNILGASNGI